MLENLRKCQHDIGFIRDNLLSAGSKGNPVDFIIIQKLLEKTMQLKTDLDQFVTAKEIDEI